MEQKRTIWIVLAAGIFLCVVLGAAVILYAAEARKNTTALQKRNEGAVWMSPELAQENKASDLYASSSPRAESSKLPELAKVDGAEEIPAVSSTPVDAPASKASDASSNKKAEANVFAATSVASSIDQSDQSANDQNTNGVSSENVTVIATGKTNVYSMGETATTTIDLNDLSAYKKDETPSGNVTAQNKAAAAAIRETSSAHKNASTQATPKKVYEQPKAQASSTSSKAVAQKKSTPAKPAVAKSAPAQPATSRFWVQAGSFTTTKNADQARSELESNKIPCEVFTSDVSGVLHYRVRVGPYTTKSEAEYWKQRIDEIPLFSKSGSFVTATKSTS